MIIIYYNSLCSSWSTLLRKKFSLIYFFICSTINFLLSSFPSKVVNSTLAPVAAICEATTAAPPANLFNLPSSKLNVGVFI